MAKFEKTIANLEELKASQETWRQKALDKGDDERVGIFDGRLKALATAIKHLTRKRNELLGI